MNLNIKLRKKRLMAYIKYFEDFTISILINFFKMNPMDNAKKMTTTNSVIQKLKYGSTSKTIKISLNILLNKYEKLNIAKAKNNPIPKKLIGLILFDFSKSLKLLFVIFFSCSVLLLDFTVATNVLQIGKGA